MTETIHSKIYEIPAQMSIGQAIFNMVAMAKEEHVVVIAFHNSIELGATPSSTEAEVIAQWDRKKREREVSRSRIEPVRIAIRYLLSTVSPEDRILLVKEMAKDPLQ